MTLFRGVKNNHSVKIFTLDSVKNFHSQIKLNRSRSGRKMILKP